MSHVDQRNIETNHLYQRDEDETDELPVADRIGSTTALVRSLAALKHKTVSISLFTVLSGFGIWMWFLHQRTDRIIVIESKVNALILSVDRLESILIKKALAP